jgi:hypothetical protein
MNNNITNHVSLLQHSIKEVRERKKKQDTLSNLEQLLNYTPPNYNNSWILNVENNIDKFSDNNFCDSKQFLFQNKIKHTFIIGKRGVGKSYSTFKYLVETWLNQILTSDLLADSILLQNKEPMMLDFYIGFILENAHRNRNLVDTLNEFIDITIENVAINFDIVGNKLALIFNIDVATGIIFRKGFYIGEIYYLTQPMQARNKQHKKLKYVIFDEFEKAFSRSLLDDDLNSLSSDKLFSNFLEIQNSFARNTAIRFLYLGNITNLNSPIWQFLEIDTFDFVSKIIDKKETSKILVLNIIPIFTNEIMTNIFEDATTLGIDETALFNLEHRIDPDNKIENIDYNTTIIVTPNNLIYINTETFITNVKTLDHKTLITLHEQLSETYTITTKIPNNTIDLKNKWLYENNYPTAPFLHSLVPESYLKEHIYTEHTKTKSIKAYNISNLDIKNTVLTDPNLLRPIITPILPKLLFDNIRSYTLLYDLFN